MIVLMNTLQYTEVMPYKNTIIQYNVDCLIGYLIIDFDFYVL